MIANIPLYTPLHSPQPVIEQVMGNDQQNIRGQMSFNYSIEKPPRAIRLQNEQLVEQFLDQITKIDDLLYKYGKQVFSSILESTRILLLYNLDSINMEITSADSLFILAKSGDKKIYWEVFFNTNNPSPKVVLNVFENKQQIFSDSGTFRAMQDELESIIQHTKAPLNSSIYYGIPYNIATTTLF